VALVRKQAKAGALLPGARLEQGDARDTAALSRALAGCDAVISALGPRKISLFRQVTLLSEATRALVSVMDRQQPPRLVCITGLGAGDSAGHGGFAYDRLIKPLLLRTIYEDKDRQEAIIKDSLLNWVIVRPTVLTDKPASGRIRAITDLEGFHGGQISRADVATFVVAQASGNEWLRQTPLITQQTGPNHQRQRPVGDTARTRGSV
jgi:putative NADH-flavin reductase